MIRWLIVLSFSLSVLTAQSTTSGPIEIAPSSESFLRLMAMDDPDEATIDTMLRVVLQYLFQNQDTCLLLATRAEEISGKNFPGQRIHANAMLYLADAHRIRSEWDLAEEKILAGLEIYRELGRESEMAASYLKLGAIKTRVEEYELAIEYHLQALAIWERLDDEKNVFKPYFEISEIFYLLDQPDKAMEYNEKALLLSKERGWDGVLMHAYGNKATLEKSMAVEFMAMADTSTVHSSIYRDSAAVYFALAGDNLEKGLELTRASGSRRTLFIRLCDLMDLRTEQGQYEAALVAGREAETLANQLGSGRFLLQHRISMAKLLRLSGSPEEAIKYGEEGLATEAIEGNAMEESNLHEQLYLAYRSLGNSEKALDHFETYTRFREANEKVERTEIISELEARYQSAKKEKEIVELNAKNIAIAKQRNTVVGAALIFGILLIFGIQLTRMRRDRNQQIAFAEALLDGQEEERRRIARDLHDGIGQSLLVVKREMEATQTTTLENQRMIATTLEEVRSIARGLHPAVLEKFGLTAAIREMVERIQHSEPDLFLTTELAKIDKLLTPPKEVQVYRAIQEALNNVIKHAEATAAKITISREEGLVRVTIRDNGKGIGNPASLNLFPSLGLRTMRERMSAINGNFTIGPGEGKGTIVQLSIPVK